MRLGWGLLLLVGCGPEPGERDFNGASVAVLVPCSFPLPNFEIDALFGIIQANRVSCGSEFNPFSSPPEEHECDFWRKGVEERDGTCPGGLTNSRSDIIVFHHLGWNGLDDLEGQLAFDLEVFPCNGRRNAANIEPVPIDGTIQFVEDQGESVLLNVETEVLTDSVTARYCR
ncbi:MAG: hypothetical protein AAGA48_13705 [Myxococcota bacterium]